MVITESRIDWWRVIVDLERSGLSQRDIAVACGINGHSAINQLKNIPGTQPLFGRGVRIIVLWMERTGKGTEDLPRA